ncbi:hypothetical protein A2U01_0024890 [Trifolium medium]|uniref:Uncharacterized protein n=1 Tax=Trifolium medium TaxID=97028 RepID=A0A392NXD0_9FABA|nr:hypothetical protein [Trifolium medium]
MVPCDELIREEIVDGRCDLEECKKFMVGPTGIDERRWRSLDLEIEVGVIVIIMFRRVEEDELRVCGGRCCYCLHLQQKKRNEEVED